MISVSRERRETRARTKNIKVKQFVMHRPWPVSHPNGRSDKGSLSGGPEEIISRSHALTPLGRVL